MRRILVVYGLMFCINNKINSLEHEPVTKKFWEVDNLKGLGEMLSTPLFCQRTNYTSNKSVIAHNAM